MPYPIPIENGGAAVQFAGAGDGDDKGGAHMARKKRPETVEALSAPLRVWAGGHDFHPFPSPETCPHWSREGRLWAWIFRRIRPTHVDLVRISHSSAGETAGLAFCSTPRDAEIPEAWRAEFDDVVDLPFGAVRERIALIEPRRNFILRRFGNGAFRIPGDPEKRRRAFAEITGALDIMEAHLLHGASSVQIVPTYEMRMAAKRQGAALPIPHA